MLKAALFRIPSDTILSNDGRRFPETFGPDNRPLFRVEGGVGVQTIVGEFSTQVSAGFWRASGRVEDLAASLDPKLGAVSLRLVPLAVSMRWTADMLAERFEIPFALFVHAGYAAVPWRYGRVETPQEISSGWAFGAEAGGGIHLVLDSFDRRGALEARREFHIRSSRLFFELNRTWWKSEQRDFSGTTLGLGVMIVF